jgi:hypothetical protein
MGLPDNLGYCFMYPAFQSPPPTLSFTDQFAFHPTGSPAAAIISLLNSITNLLTSNPFVTVISLDFSKAFDTVRHSTLLEKLALLDMPANAYNWLVDFFSGHSHCTVYRGQTSALKDITASIIQGSGIGPASYVANASDLKAVTPETSSSSSPTTPTSSFRPLEREEGHAVCGVLHWLADRHVTYSIPFSSCCCWR